MRYMDDLDLFILHKIIDSALNHKEITTWEIAKAYNWGYTREKTNSFYNDKTNSIKYRLDCMEKDGLVQKEKNLDSETKREKIDYIVDGNIKYIQKYKFPDKKIGNCLMVKKIKWTIYEV